MPCIHLDSPNEGWHGPPTQNPRSVCCAGTLEASPTQSLMNCTVGWICLSIASIRSCFYRKHTGPSRQNGQQADGLSYIPVLPSIKEVVFLRSLTRIYAPLLLFERENCSQAGFSIPGFRWTVGFLLTFSTCISMHGTPGLLRSNNSIDARRC